MSRRTTFIAWTIVLALMGAAPRPADLVLLGGKVVTVDAENRIGQAVAVRGGRIVAVGSDAEVQPYVGPATRVVRLAGKMVLPGLIESHVHSLGAARASLGEPYVQLGSIAEIQRWIGQNSARTRPGTWLQVPRNDLTRLAERRHPTTEELDEACSTHPVAYESARKWAFNSLGWKVVGLDDPAKTPRGVKVIRDAQGRPLLAAGIDMRPFLPLVACSDEEWLGAVCRLFRIYNSVGITSLYERASNPEGYKLMGEAVRRCRSMRASVAFRRSLRSAADVEACVKELGLKPRQGDDWLSAGPIKMTLDGGIHWGTTRLSEPYGQRRAAFYRLDDPDYRGEFSLEDAPLRDVVAAAHRLGWQVCVHVTGDGGLDRVLTVLEDLDRGAPVRPHRFTVTHAYFPTPELAARAARLGVCIDTQPYLYLKDSAAMAEVYGPAWAERMIGLATWRRAGVRVAINSDHMIGLDPDRAMNSFNPFLAMAIAVRRANDQGRTYGPDQRVDRMSALRMMTAEAAWIGFQEQQTGSLEPGKLADLVVIDRDYLDCPEEQIAAIKVVATVVGGRVVWGSLAGLASAELRFEAEQCVANREAVLTDRFARNRWTLWTTDRDAAKKWSGSATLKSPEVKADRASPDEGAPPLHLVLKGIPKGTYDVRVKRGRALAVSEDGRQWRRLVGDVVARDVTIDGGTYEFWADDMFAEEKPQNRGSSYLDWIALEPAAPVVAGVPNGDFELIGAGKPLGWSLPAASAAVVEGDAHSGQCALRFATPAGDGGRWECACLKSLPVKPGQSLRVSAWVKGTIERAASVLVDGFCDGQLVKRIVGQAVLEDAPQWKRYCGYFDVPEGVTELRLGLRGSGPMDLLVDDVALEPAPAVRPKGQKVSGWARTRPVEKLDRGVVALRTARGAYVSWRLLASDPPQAAFKVLRTHDGGPAVEVSKQPITKTCDLVDPNPPRDGVVVYQVVPQNGGKPAGEAVLAGDGTGTPHLTVKLKEPDLVANRVALADLDGDGAMDFVIKHPNQSIDPAGSYWRPSEDTYKLDAYTSQGKFLWRRDLGWSIETGIWYSPYIVCDLDGDGRAEVVTKTGEGDPRGPDGRVSKGPEWLTVIDGLTGRDKARVPWPSRKGFAEYSRMARNQLAMAYLDGKTPCVLALRGTYCRMKVEAYQLVGGELRPVWRYDNAAWPTACWGQGAHTTRVADVDGDGRDEVLLGSACLDDDGTPLWTTGRGHPDGAHLGDLLPSRPGMEVFYCVETPQQRDGGLCLVEAATGKQIWALEGYTRHVHSGGMCSDLDPALPGCECYGADTDQKKRTNRAWLFNADGTLLATGVRYGSTQPTVFWDADLQREVFGGRIFDHGGGPLEARPERGKVTDMIGDWREEIIAAVPGELRVYSTTLPAMDRRVCLLQDPVYRACVCMSSMGYETPPTVSASPAASAANLNLTFIPDPQAWPGKAPSLPGPGLRVAVSASATAALSGPLTLRAEGPFKLKVDRLPIDLKPGGVFVRDIEVDGIAAGRPTLGRIVAELQTAQGPLRGEVHVEWSGNPAPRDAKVQANSRCDQKGQVLEWSVDVPARGRYMLIARYHAPAKTVRRLWLNGADLGQIEFPQTRGQGDKFQDWDEVNFADPDGKPFRLDRGSQKIRLENVDGNTLGLDTLGFTTNR